MIRGLSTLVLGALLMLGGCSVDGSDGDDAAATPTHAAYSPLPDDQLFAHIADLPGVTSVDIRFNGTWPEAKYGGEITIAPDADAQDVLDAAYAVLRQGRPGAGISVFGIQNRASISFDRLGGRAGTPAQLAERYGEQPGDGKPPTD